MAQEVGADILDVNCGCPAPKVVKHGGGSGLLRDLPRLETILKEIKKVITIPLDRKSTRLNSSHANISYAVFCLKKKKKRWRTSLTQIKVATNINFFYSNAIHNALNPDA